MTKWGVLIVLTLTGCISPYAQFYEGRRGGRSLPGATGPFDQVEVYGSSDLNADVRRAYRRGYVPMGASSFNSGGNMTDSAYARSFAKEIGAQMVLIKSNYSHTVSGSIPITTPTSSTSYTTGTATAYGSGGSATAYGSATTTTYGSKTTYVPYSVARSDYTAVFLIRISPRLGVKPVELDAGTRARIQTNAGVIVDDIVEGSTAYTADILPGDVILFVGGDKVVSLEAYYKLLDKHQGSSPVILLDRNGERIEKTVEIRRLPTPPPPSPDDEPESKPTRNGRR